MIGKPEWFARRKYSGWGVIPKTWQGWLYLAIVLIPFVVFQSLPYWSLEVRGIVTAVWLLFLLVDITDIMIRLPKDERERVHEAIAERNALWVVMLVLVLGILYETVKSGLNKSVVINPFIIAALIAGLVVKAISNFYLSKKN